MRSVIIKKVDRELWFRPELTGWTPERTENARLNADTGILLELADLVETMMRDDRIGGVLDTRTLGLLGLPIEFNGGSEKIRAQLVESNNDDDHVGKWWLLHDESELAQLQAWGLMLGVGLAQRVPLPRVVGQPQMYRLEVWSPRWLTYFQDIFEGAHWKVQTRDGMKSVIAGDGEWILYLPYGRRRPWSCGLWNRVVFPWLLKRFSLEDRANFSEVLGSPIWVGTTKHASTEKQRNKFLGQLRGLGKAGKVVLPEGWDFQLREAANKSWEIFDGQISWADTAITIALAGQIVTTEGTAGFSSGDIHDSIKSDFIRFDAERLATCLKEQSLEPWARENYGVKERAPWPKWNVQRPVDQQKRGEAIANAGKAIADLDLALAPHGLTVDAESLVSEYGIPVTKLQSTPNSETLTRKVKRK